jgi:hypothetical protein
MWKSRLVLAALGLCLLGGAASAHDPIKNKTPDDLDLVPRDAFMAMQVRVGDLTKRFGPSLMARLEQMEEDILTEGEKHMGFPLLAVERLTMVMPSDNRAMPAMIVTLSQPLDRTKVMDALLKAHSIRSIREGNENVPPPPQRQERQVKGRTVYVLEQEYFKRALCFLSDRMFVYGDTSTVTAALEAAEKPDTGSFVTECRKLAGQKPPLFIVMNMENLPPQGRKEFEQAPIILPILVQAKLCTITVTATKGLEVKAEVTFADNTQASIARKNFNEDLTKLRMLLPMGIKEMAHEMVENPDAPEHFYAFMKTFDAKLQQMQVELDGTTVRAVLRHDGDDKSVAGLVTEFPMAIGGMATGTFGSVARSDDARIRPDKAATIQKIAAAFEKYKEKHGHYPAPAIYGPDGTPLLSWRVAILPYLGEEQLYQQFKLNEPWHSKHNRPLLKKMPKVLGGHDMGDYTQRSAFRMILGPGAAYDGKDGVKPADLKDRAGQTLLVVENVRWRHVAWTRPEGYRFGDEWPLPRLTYGDHDKGFYALFADGKVRFVKHDVDEKTFRAMIAKNSSEKVAEKDLGEVVK